MRRIKLKAPQPDASGVAEAVAALRKGDLVVLPTETVYGLAADPDNPAALARLVAWKGRAPEQPFTHHLASAERATVLARALPPRVRKLVDRFWPGPLTLVAPALGSGTVGLRVPAHPFTNAVLEQFERGLFLTSVNRSGSPPLQTPDEMFEQLGGAASLLVDAGPPALGTASAVVSCVSDEMEVLRQGTLTTDELLRAAAWKVLFVCTGNTCRSPLAAASTCKHASAALDVPPSRLLARGLDVGSAGTHAHAGSGASENSIVAGREVGLDLSGHRARMVTADELAGAALVFGLSSNHVASMRTLQPKTADRIHLLDPSGRDIPDPFGADLATYRQARDAMDAAVRARLAEIVALVG